MDCKPNVSEDVCYHAGTAGDDAETTNIPITLPDGTDVAAGFALEVVVTPPSGSADTYVYGVDSEVYKEATDTYWLRHECIVAGAHDMKVITTTSVGVSVVEAYFIVEE